MQTTAGREASGRRSWLRAPIRRILLLIAVLLSTSAALWTFYLTHLPPPAQPPHLSWWALTAMFAVAEVVVLHIQVRREAQTVSLSEIPLVLGLLFAVPRALVVGWLLGPALVFLIHRRQAPIKIGYNLALLLTQACVSVTVFHLLAADRAPLGPWVWLATYLVVGLCGGISAIATTIAIALYEGTLRWRDLLTQPAWAALTSMMVGTVALVATHALHDSMSAAWPLLASLAVLLLGYRTYAALSERHLSLERLYHFSQVVSSSPEVDEVLRSVLEEAKELLRSEQAEISFLPGYSGRPGLRITLGPANRLARAEVSELDTRDWLWAKIIEEASPVLIGRGTKEQALRRYLETRQLREAIIAPLRGEAGVVGTISVADRMGDVRTFDRDDLQLLETVANHASVALQNSQLVDQLRHEALHDALTGLPNRVFFQRRLREALEKLAAAQLRGMAVMIMDLDGFKEVNDTLGHQHGDLLLKEVALRLTSAAGPTATVARLGGDEFAMLLPATVEADAAVLAGRRLLRALEEPVGLNDIDVQVGASIGIALAPEHGADPSVLLKRADVAMYTAKGATKGVWLYEPSLDTTTSPQRLALVGELRQAITLDQLTIYVQPKAFLNTAEVYSVEALVRWQHPQHGLLLPDAFVPMAERSGLIRPLTMAVLRQALAACAAWRKEGRELSVAVNLSARSLLDLDLADDVAALVRRYNLPGQLLTLELTEGSVMTDPTRTIGLLVQLADMGIRLSVDDFGTGYSSLSYLKRLPVHEVKVDKSFVTNMCHDSDDATIVRSIVDLAGNLSLDVVAEGVEDQTTWDRLQSMGCTAAQGYYLSRPMPLEEFAPWLEQYEQKRAVHTAEVGGTIAFFKRPKA